MCWYRFCHVLEKQMYWLILIGLMETTRSHLEKLEESEKQVDGCVFLFFIFLSIQFTFPSFSHFLLLCQMENLELLYRQIVVESDQLDFPDVVTSGSTTYALVLIQQKFCFHYLIVGGLTYGSQFGLEGFMNSSLATLPIFLIN